MGKKNRHSQDRLFITSNCYHITIICLVNILVTETEWARDYGGKKAASSSGNAARPLPFDHCAMSLGPYETPVCTAEGVIFDIVNLVPYLQKHKTNPVTGAPMTTKDIIRLNMQKNAEGKWHCPVTCKVFNNNTHIVAIKSTGNVYTYDAVNELNIKPKHFVDLLTNEPFTKGDILVLQDPSDADLMSRRDISTFVHLNQVREDTAAEKELEPKVRANPISVSVMKEMDRLKDAEQDRGTKYRQMQSEHSAAAAGKEFTDDVKELLELEPLTEDVTPGQSITTGKAGNALTSSTAEAWTDNSSRLATAEELREARWRTLRKLGKKAHAQIQTTHGNLNIELHCDMAQRTCWNFITLALKGYYNGTSFHRLVPGFMVQGGDPTGTGCGGTSAWGKAFKDEFDSRIWHDFRGVVSMANSGPHTNQSQFFITLGKAEHLNNMHSVFGKVVGGMSTLDRIESVGSDKKERPLAPISINEVVIFTNPLLEADEILADEIRNRIASRNRSSIRTALPSSNAATSANAGAAPAAEKLQITQAAVPKASRKLEEVSGEGDQEAISAFLGNHSGHSSSDSLPKKKARGFGNFSSW
jgi:peptidyl-prolyl cis-trans isomerase-like protein 2